MGGDFSSMWEGPIADAPWTMVTAINQALMVISWYENLPRKEQPPRHIWWSDELVSDWFRNVQENRESRTSSRSSYQDAEDAPMTENELAAQYRPR